MLMPHAVLLGVAAFGWATFAVAAPVDEAEAAYERGAFDEARVLGRAAGTPDKLALACEAGLILGSYLEDAQHRVASLHDAIMDCAAAIDSGEAEVGAYVNYAIGVAIEAKRLRSPGRATDARRLFDEAIAKFPESGFAHGALAGWHSNVSREGALAKIALGASRADARRGFKRALALDPTNAAIRYEYLRFLAAGDREDRERAMALGDELLSAAPRDAFERLLLDRAALVREALNGPKKALEATLTATEPYSGVEGERAHHAFSPPFGESFSQSAPCKGERTCGR